MIHAYNKLYLEHARNNFATMLDFAVNELQQDITKFIAYFSVSGLAALFELGDPNTTVGKSGIELAYETLETCGLTVKRITPRFRPDRSKEYWAGWALAYYQWKTSLSFSSITKYIPITDIVDMYTPYHEMDIEQFVDKMTELFYKAKPETNLKIIRERAGFTQKRLAEESGVPIRTLQQYEQRQKNINKAQAEYIFKLAAVLKCKPIELIELV